jgi:hypothetical protein
MGWGRARVLPPFFFAEPEMLRTARCWVLKELRKLGVVTQPHDYFFHMFAVQGASQ